MSLPLSPSVAFSSGSDRSIRKADKQSMEVLEGHLHAEKKPTSTTVRLFVSSDLIDTRHERRALAQHVYTHLKQFSRSLGLQLHIVDLYANLRSCDSNRELLYELEDAGVFNQCLKEIELCQRISAGPSFITFLAQRLGHKPLQKCIMAEDFPLLCAAMEDPASGRLMQQCYELDTNAQPPRYTLKECVIRWSSWTKTHEVLSKAIWKAAKIALGKDPSKVQYYSTSVSEEEVTQGIFNCRGNPNRTSLWFKRTFADLYHQRPATDSALYCYSDIILGRSGAEFDQEMLKTLNYLKEARMPAKYVGLDASNIFEFLVKWQKNRGLDPNSCPEHSQYITDLCRQFSETLMGKLSQVAGEVEQEMLHPVQQEVLLHAQHCTELIRQSLDCPNVMEKIQSYLDDSSVSPLVVHGDSGTGKSFLVACAVSKLRERNPRQKKCTVVRFVGLTPRSSSIKRLLAGICEQIAVVYRLPMEVPFDFRSLTSHFSHLLTQAQFLYIFIDGVDQLSPDDGALGLSWLPLQLPPHVKMVVSTSSEVEYGCYPVLRSLIKMEDCFIQIPPLDHAECQRFLRHHLSLLHRKLSADQQRLAMAAVRRCTSPRFIQCLAQQAAQWSSSSVVSGERVLMSRTVPAILEIMFEDLETTHGKILVSHTLAYLSVAQFGLSEPEILDILSSDNEVLSQVESGASSLPLSRPVMAVPPLVWSKLLHDLLKMMAFRASDGGALVIRWRNRALYEVACHRYLSSGMNWNELLADYFSGNMAKKRKQDGPPSSDVCSRESTHSSSRSRERPIFGNKIDPQPLVLNPESQLYNIRKLIELPHSLARALQGDKLKGLLTDYQWLCAGNVTNTIEDTMKAFTTMAPKVPIGRQRSSEDKELRILQDALSLSAMALAEDPSQLCVQLVSRLLPHLVGSATERPLLKKLVTEALEKETPLLVPLSPLSITPGGPLLLSLAGHVGTVTSVTAVVARRSSRMKEPSDGSIHSLVVISASTDRSLRSWDVKTSGVLKTFDGHTDKVLSVALSNGGEYVASGSQDKTVRFWLVASGECLHTMTGHRGAVNSVVITRDGSKTISGSSDATIRVWNTRRDSSCKGEVIYTMKAARSSVCKLALAANDYQLVAGTESGKILSMNIVSGEVMWMLSASSTPVSALAIGVMDVWMIVVSGSDEDHSFQVWDLTSGKALSRTGLSSPACDLAVGAPGILVVAHKSGGMASVWDLRSNQDQFGLVKGSEEATAVCITDEGRLAVTGSSAAMLHIWDLTSPPLSLTSSSSLSIMSSAALMRSKEKAANLALSPCGSYLISVNGASVIIQDSEDLSILRRMTDDQSIIRCLFILRDSKHFLMGHGDGSVSLRNGESGELVRKFSGHTASITCLAASYDSKLLMSGSENGQVGIWSLQQGSKLKTFHDHSTALVAVSFTPATRAHKYMLSADEQGKMIVKQFESAASIHTTPANSGSDTLSCINFSLDGKDLVCGYGSGTVHVLVLPSLDLKSEFMLNERVTSVTFLPGTEDQHLAVLTTRAVQLWDSTSKQCLAQFLCDSVLASTVADPKISVLFYRCVDGHIGRLWYPKRSGDSRESPILQQLRGEGVAQEYHSSGSSDGTSTAGTTPTTSTASISNNNPRENSGIEELDSGHMQPPAHIENEGLLPQDQRTVASSTDSKDESQSKQSNQWEEEEETAAAKEGRPQSQPMIECEPEVKEKQEEDEHKSSSICTLI